MLTGLSPLAISVRGRGITDETRALLARMTVPPSEARARDIDACIRSLKTAGVWPKLECLYFPAAHDAQAAQRNWIADSYNLSLVNAPTFTTDRGYAGDGSTSYLNTGWNPSTSALSSQNSGSLAQYLNGGTDTANSSVISMGCYNGSNSAWSVVPRHGTDVCQLAVNTVSVSTIGSTTRMGFIGLSRTGASANNVRRDAATTTSTAASAAPPNYPIFLGCRNNANTPGAFSNNRFAMAAFGAGLTSTELGALYTATLTYLTAIGAN